MSYYKRGATFQKQEHIGFEGPWIATPGFLKDELDNLNIDVQTFVTDIQRIWKAAHANWLLSLGPDIDQLSQVERDFPFNDDDPGKPLYRYQMDVVSPWNIEWNAFYAKHTEGPLDGWTQRMWGSLWDSIKERRRRLIELRAKAQEFIPEGEILMAPEPRRPMDSGWSALWDGAKTAIIVGGIGIGALFGIKLLSLFKSGGGGGSYSPPLSLPPASFPKAKTKADAQATRVYERIKEKSR